MLEEYLNNSLNNPKYLFHGSPNFFEMAEPRQAHDALGTKYNEDFAVFLTSSFIISTAYAFKDRIKKISDNLPYDFDIGYDANNDEIYIQMNNVNVDDDLTGYVYVFSYDETYEHYGRSIQYKCHKAIQPIDVIKIKFSDYKMYYEINQDIKKL